MKLKTLITSLLTSFLVGCGAINQGTTVQPAPVQQQAARRFFNTPAPQKASVFDSVSFPQDTCGEKLPDDHRAYPMELFPVFIKYSESNLELVRENFCKDAFKTISQDTGQQAIQVASFIGGSSLAYQFAEFLNKKLGSGEVGKPTVKNKNSENIPISVKPIASVAEAAKLTPAQAVELISVGKVATGVRQEKIFTLSIVVPTYIPSGFKIDELNVVPGRGYNIIYRNSNNFCFSIEGFGYRAIGGSPTGYDFITVSSPALDKVVIDYTGYDQVKNTGYLGTPEPQFSRGLYHAYKFDSPGVRSELFYYLKPPQTCKSISLQEAIKVVESLQYLNP